MAAAPVRYRESMPQTRPAPIRGNQVPLEIFQKLLEDFNNAVEIAKQSGILQCCDFQLWTFSSVSPAEVAYGNAIKMRMLGCICVLLVIRTQRCQEIIQRAREHMSIFPTQVVTGEPDNG
jgi:hypothetical protein